MDNFSVDFESNAVEGSEFLNGMALGTGCTGADSSVDWKYEQRREAQEILPFLFLGPVSAARDRRQLTNQNITMVMAIRDTLSAQANLLQPRTPVELGLEVVNIDVAGNQELIAAFPKAIAAINHHLSSVLASNRQQRQEQQNAGQEPICESTGRVLVFCESGNERSAGAVAAYIMAMYSLDFVKAVQFVLSRRFCCCFDEPMRVTLQTYDSMLLAKRQVAKSRKEAEAMESLAPMQAASSTVLSQGKAKRGLDDVYERDADMDDEGNLRDEARFEQRHGCAPFGDGMS
jgi:hypothetical protein